MVRKALFMGAAALLSIVAVACGGRQGGRTGNSEATTEGTTMTEECGECADCQDCASQSKIPEIASVWASKPITGVMAGKPAAIELFAKAFCKEYPSYLPNKTLCDYFDDKAAFENRELPFTVDHQAKSGFLSCRLLTEYDYNTDCCYWNRPGGHKLVAFWLVESHEGSETIENLLACYDFDPKTDVMTPVPAITRKVEETVKDYDVYTVKLPEEGKDIDLVAHKFDKENDDVQSACYILRWNGEDFAVELQPE